MKFGSTFGCVALGVFATVLAPASAVRSQPVQDAPAELRYVRVKEGGAKLFNLADKGADVVLKPAAGTLLQVHGASAGFLEVAAPGGLEVWVFGEFARPASETGMLEITANSVGMRPQPNASEKSYRLAQRLNKGDEVRYLGRNDPTKPIAEDWLKIQSPSTARAWVLATETTALAAGEDGQQLFRAAERDALAKAKVESVPGGATPALHTAAKGAKAADAKPENAAARGDLLAQAERLREAAIQSDKPDFRAVKAAYQKVLDTEKQGPAADTARRRLEELDAREELALLRSDAAKGQGARQDEIARKAEEVREASLYQDRLWGRFQDRGWLEQDGDRYILRWANNVTSEVTCSQKRYDLRHFVGFEIGVTGTLTRSAVQGTIPADAKPAKVDIARIEVLSGAGPKR